MSDERVDLHFEYDNFPCTVPLAKGQEKAVAQMLYETDGIVPIDDLMQVCGQRRQTVHTRISALRQKLEPGVAIESTGNGYRMIFGVEERTPNAPSDAILSVKRDLECKAHALNEEIRSINEQLQSLNRRKEILKRKLEVIEVGALALEELTEGDGEPLQSE